MERRVCKLTPAFLLGEKKLFDFWIDYVQMLPRLTQLRKFASG